MCIAALALGVHPDFPFICVANRDEFHNRPTAPLQAWPAPVGFVLAGKDLQSGGSWLGLGSQGEFALLTNVRNAALNLPATAPSRGELVFNAIEDGQGPTEETALKYAGFNLVHGNLNTLTLSCTSNQGLKLNNGVPFSVLLEPGIYSVSNGHLGAPWPKTRLLETGLRHQLECLNDEFTIANPNEDYQSSDIIDLDKKLPERGLIFYAKSKSTLVLYYSISIGPGITSKILFIEYNAEKIIDFWCGNSMGRADVKDLEGINIIINREKKLPYPLGLQNGMIVF